MNLIRWNDDRLDEWAGRYDRLDSKVNGMDDSLRDVVHDVNDIKHSSRLSQSVQLWRWMFIATILSPISTIIAVILTRGK